MIAAGGSRSAAELPLDSDRGKRDNPGEDKGGWAMFKKAIGTCLVVGLGLALVAVVPASAGTTDEDSSVTATYHYPTKLFGKVHAMHAECEAGRKVRAIHISGQNGDRTVAGSDMTDGSGAYSIKPSVTPVEGDSWLVKVKEKTTSTHRCLPARVKIPA